MELDTLFINISFDINKSFIIFVSFHYTYAKVRFIFNNNKKALNIYSFLALFKTYYIIYLIGIGIRIAQ